MLLVGRPDEAEKEFAAAMTATVIPEQKLSALEGKILALLVQSRQLEAARYLEAAERETVGILP